MKLVLLVTIFAFAILLVACRQNNTTKFNVPEDVKQGDAYKVLDFAFQRFELLLTEGKTPRELEAAATRVLEQCHANGYFKGFHKYPAILCVSINEQTVHTPPSDRHFESGDIVKIEFGVEKGGQHAFQGWTYPIGSIDAEKKRLIIGATAALEAGVMKAKAGNMVSAISQAIQNALTARGLVPSQDYVGYQIGSQPIMRPPIPCFYEGEPKQDAPLEPGQKLMILVIAHPVSNKLVVQQDGWTVSAKDGKPSALISATVEIQEGGGQRITQNRSVPQNIHP